MSNIKTIKSGNDLVFPEFDDNKVSTKTVIAITNLQLNIQNVFDNYL
jgi:hypothetical protein